MILIQLISFGTIYLYQSYKGYLFSIQIKEDWMSNLNLFQDFIKQTLAVQLLGLNPNVTALLDYFEYLIRIQFNASDKKKSKNRKKEISNQLAQSFTTLSREEKVQYYMRLVEDIRHVNKGNFNYFRQLNSGVFNDIGYSRSFSIRRWKQKQLRFDQDKHLLFAQRQSKIKTYDLSDYILRLSKNKDFFSFVLEAINKNPVQKSRTVHLGFSTKPVFQKWYRAIKTSIQFKQWEYVLSLMKSKFGAKGNNKMITSDEAYQDKHNNTFAFENKYDTSKQQKQQEYDNMFLSKSMLISGMKKQEFKEQMTTFRPIKNSYSLNNSPERIATKERKEQMQSIDDKEKSKLQNEIKVYEEKKIQSKLDIGKTYVDQLIQGDVFEQPDVFLDKVEDQEEQKKQTKKNLDLFHKLYPEYELDELQMYYNYKILYEEENFKIYQSQIIEKRLKMVITFHKYNHSVLELISIISKIELTKEFNENIQQINVKTFISSQNSAVIYQVFKPYNRLYRSRDFIFIRHVFKSNNIYYMIDKSIQNTNYPPFMTIVRGQLCNVYGIFQRQDTYELIADFQVANEGYLNMVQETNLTLKYLKGFSKLKSAKIDPKSYKFFNLQWDLNKNEVNHIQDEIRVRRKTILQINKKSSSTEKKIQESKDFSKKSPHTQNKIQNPKPKQKVLQKVKLQKIPEIKQIKQSVKDNSPKIQVKRFDKYSMDEIGQINAEQIKAKQFKTQLAVLRKLDKNGCVIINDSFRNHKYILYPIQKCQRKFMNYSQGHPVWKDEWIHDMKQGGIIFVHKKKIEDQKGVLKFILSKMVKNIVTGQSILNISLPVDIFSPQSNLQRFLYSMVYGPTILQGLEKESALNRLLKVIIFGVSNSILYLSMQKPFNPILGETFQCWINGCPAYGQQISHHPPIAALLLKGRGYDITAQLQSKVSLGANSGTGTNDGIYRVKFKDNVEICFITAGGEVSGLTRGDRKFNLVGKGYYWITNQNIIIQLVCDPYKKGFFSSGKQQEPSDFLEGIIWEVKPEFMAKFLSGKYKQPQQKDRVNNLGKVNGIWNKYLSFNGHQIFNFDKSYPLQLEYESIPLPSDSNWREDIEYRRRNETTKAQTEKERLQIIQRKDRKTRQKYTKKKQRSIQHKQ